MSGLRRPSDDDKPACEAYRRDLIVRMLSRIRAVMEVVRKRYPFEAKGFAVFVLDTADPIARSLAEVCFGRDGTKGSSCSCGGACGHTIVTVALPEEHSVAILRALHLIEEATLPIMSTAHVRVVVIAAGGFGVSEVEPMVQAFSRVVAGGQA